MNIISNGKPKCERCGITDLKLLTIDHIDESGYLDKKSGITHLYRSIVNGNYPKEKLSNLRVLCYNHNLSGPRKYLDLSYEKQNYHKRDETKLWKEAFNFFGGCKCGITDIKFLTISHIHNDGAERRKNGEPSATDLIRKFRKMEWPEKLKKDYCLECFNCNCSRD